jgi:plasmid stabilization system protein ParE
MYNLEVRDEAQFDLDEAYIWYELQQIDLGRRLVLLVRDYMQILKTTPKQFPIIYKKKRSVSVQDFPYKIIFSIYSDTVVIFSIFHTKRNPKNWKKR